MASLDTLAPPFKVKAALLHERILRDGLPFVLFEARRSFSKQHGYYLKGRRLNADGSYTKIGQTVTNAKPGESAHQWGLAADFVLDVNHPWWEGAAPTGPWDAGEASRPMPILAWQKFGRLARESGLIWGGDWASFKDLPHVELPDWKRSRPANWAVFAQNEIAAGR